MPALERGLRGRLDRSVREARDIAEAGARAVLEQLGVGEANPPSHLTPEQKELRRKLRIHGRQLGDLRDGTTAVQELDRLLEEVAYEHWHRMLFARFLAENNLLMHTGHGVPIPVTLEECQELAPGEGARDGWELAARFASKMLPQIFRPDSPVFLIELPPEHQQRLEKLLADLPVDVFTACDSLGWVYQFWQAKRKDEINKSEVKIGARELPAVTQLFTEPYMVSFLLDNSLGAWWAARRLTETDLATAETEDELRQKASLPGMPLEYLRFIRKEGESNWSPASGSFPGWPEHLADFKMLDPCCGSGHFLVAILSMLVPMRMTLEGLTAREATDLVLSQNIHGLEIDKRCVELAAFNLALAAWKYPEAGGYRVLPELNLACSGLAISAKKEDWVALGGDRYNMRLALELMYDLFKDAPTLGSLINPAKSEATKLVSWDELSTALDQALSKEQTDEQHETAITAKGLAIAAQLLSDKYTLVATNVPYLGSGLQSSSFKEFLYSQYLNGKNDLATAFLIRCINSCIGSGSTVLVTPQSWLFMKGYTRLRREILLNHSLEFIARMGAGAFETITGQVVNVALSVLSATTADQNHEMAGIDISSANSFSEKAATLQIKTISASSQQQQLDHPDHVISFELFATSSYLGKIASAYQGTSTGDNPRFVRFFLEVASGFGWKPFHGPSTNRGFYSGQEQAVNEQLFLTGQAESAIRGRSVWGRVGIGIARVGSLNPSIYSGEYFSNTLPVVLPSSIELLPLVWVFCSDTSFKEEIRRLNPSFNIDNGYLCKVPFDLAYWTQVAAEKYPNGLPKPYTDDPTQWIFHGHPCASVVWSEETKWTAFGPLRADSSVLQVAVARLLGYRWPAEVDPMMELSDESRALVAKCDELLGFADKDGIVSIPAHRGEPTAADRLVNLLAAAYGKEWSNDRLMELLASADHAGKTLESWLRDKFFTQHCALFHQKPFIWHIWDGLKDGFSVLVNYHKLDRKNLENLIYSYLGDWITRQRQEVASGIDGAQDRLAAAEELKRRLELIQIGEAPFDIFVRWKPLAKQPIGWDPDINDGVRLNIRPFVSVPDVGKKGAGVLRDKPRIHWEKDRGKDVQSAPWYPIFKGDRINDHHLTLEQKNTARSGTISGTGREQP